MDLEDILTLLCMLVIILFVITILIISVQESEKSIYECITLDGEKITCDYVSETEAGIVGRRDDTSYLIKQYKKIKKEEN